MKEMGMNIERWEDVAKDRSRFRRDLPRELERVEEKRRPEECVASIVPERTCICAQKTIPQLLMALQRLIWLYRPTQVRASIVTNACEEALFRCRCVVFFSFKHASPRQQASIFHLLTAIVGINRVSSVSDH